jgi:hypothetical protein
MGIRTSFLLGEEDVPDLEEENNIDLLFEATDLLPLEGDGLLLLLKENNTPLFEDRIILFILLASGNPLEIEVKSKVDSKWILSDLESEIEPNSKLHRSEVEANSKLNRSELESEHDSGIKLKST